MLCIATAPARQLRPIVDILASHTHDEYRDPFISGVHRANITGGDAVTAVLNFSDQVLHRLAGKPGWPEPRKPDPRYVRKPAAAGKEGK